MAGPKALAQYQQVRAKVADGLTVAAAVKAVSGETGATPGTLQSVYYRVARESGVTKPRPRAARKVHPPAPRQRAHGATPRRRGLAGSSTAELLRQLAATATELSLRIDALERDSARLRDVEVAFAQRR